jgi:hypothetical protein
MAETASMYSSSLVSALIRRYSDAYVVARTIDGFGLTIKTIGFVIAALLTLTSLWIASRGAMGAAFGAIGVAFAAAIAVVLFVLGTLTSVQGQVLKASLDTAVNTSEFLNDGDRARIMSLPVTVPGATSAVETLSRSEWRCGCGQMNPAHAAACLDCGVAYGIA